MRSVITCQDDSSRSDLQGISEAEGQTRRDLAACYRLAYRMGWNKTAFNHISARIPDQPNAFLLNPFPSLWDEITPESLLKVDEAGNRIGAGSTDMVNKAGFIIHGAVHTARPDVNCVFHVHTPAGVAVSMCEAGLIHASSESLVFTGKIGYHDFEGIVLDMDERERLVSNLADKPVLILRNHGLLVAAPSIASAFSMMQVLIDACEIQVRATACGPIKAVPHAVGLRTANQKFSATAEEGGFGTEWPALLRWLHRAECDNSIAGRGI